MERQTTMKVEYVDPFVQAAFEVITQVTGDRPERLPLALREKTFTTQQVNIVVGVTGAVEGQAVYGMSVVTAAKVAAAMIGQEVSSLDEMATSAVAELGNMITAHATARMGQTGAECEITPPSVLRGMNVEISTFVPALVVPVLTRFGRLDINVSLAETAEVQARAA